MTGCNGRAVVFFFELGFCSDCAGSIDAVRADQGFKPVARQEEPLS